ncbi:MAG TPA: ferrous iron transport protein A [Clostridium sp.]|nr:ferrous iron transport protein A [Clostridium sp.]
MGKLNETYVNKTYRVAEIRGDERFISRITSIGMTIGNEFNVIKNKASYPILLFSRDTMLAISQKEAEKIIVEAV